MSIDKKFIDQIIKVSSKAAYASSLLVGKNDKIAADKAAVDAMRTELNLLDINGKVVIGEGELDEAPMLYIGEILGTKNGPEIDIAVDPVEGTNFAAKNLPGALSVISIAEKGNLFHAPETYMDKIAAQVDQKNVVDLDYDIKKNLDNLAQYRNKNVEDLIVCILDRPRHIKIIDEINLNNNCQCSNERVLNTFKSMDQKEITYLFNEKKSIEVVCEFCKTKRVYSEQDLK